MNHQLNKNKMEYIMSDSTVENVPAKANERSILDIAQKVCEIMPIYKVRDGRANTFRNLTLAEDETANWKKGLIYFISRYSKGVNLEFWLYSTKGGAHLKDYNDSIRSLVYDGIVCEPCGHAVKLRCQLPDEMSQDDVEQKIRTFVETIEPVAADIRSKITMPEKVVEKRVVPATDTQADPTQEQPVEKVKSKSK
jgi:hypothetical protein